MAQAAETCWTHPGRDAHPGDRHSPGGYFHPGGDTHPQQVTHRGTLTQKGTFIMMGHSPGRGHSPRRTPLATPGMPWISVTLLWRKYWSQEVLSAEPLQKMPQSAVVAEPLLAVWTLAQTSKPRRDSVRFPSRQTLVGAGSKKPLATAPLRNRAWPGASGEGLLTLSTWLQGRPWAARPGLSRHPLLWGV